MSPQVIYADDNMIVVNKPPLLSVHGGKTVYGKTLSDILKEEFPEIKSVGDDPKIRPGIVHRLDKNTSGVMVVARNQDTFIALKSLFQKRLVEKIYLAICCGKFREVKGNISLPIGRLVKNPLKRGVALGSRKIRGEREATTNFEVLQNREKYSLVKLFPKTGRMHQLRVHMASIHHPIACDLMYGGKNVCCPEGAGRQLLHAKSISFSLPEGRRWYFEADLPSDFAVALEKIL